MAISNQQVSTHRFLLPLYEEELYPDHLVDRGTEILLRLCERIEAEQPADLGALYRLTQAATEEFNELEVEFDTEGAEFDTQAREEIGEEFWFVACAYGFQDADSEELISGREW